MIMEMPLNGCKGPVSLKQKLFRRYGGTRNTKRDDRKPIVPFAKEESRL